MVMQIRRTITPNNPPDDLAEGQLAVEMGSNPPRLWVGVPTSIDPSGRILLVGGGGSGGFTAGDAKLTIKNVADPGWIMMNDGTIGDALSQATTRADDDCEDLFLLMWDRITDTFAPVGGGDAQWSNVTLLFSNGTRTDQSSANQNLVVGGATPAWGLPPGGAMGLPEVVDFNAAGVANWFTAPRTSPANWNLGSAAFCIEAYIRLSYLDYSQMIVANVTGNAFQFYVNADNTLRASFAYGSGWQMHTVVGGAIPLGVWTHVAVYRIGNNFYTAVNGAPTSIGTTASAINNDTNMYIGQAPSPNFQFWGQMAGLRITRGDARYPATQFAPPPIPLALGPGRGASAEADWAAHKQLTLTRQLGRALIISGAGAGLTSRTLGSFGGAETQVLSVPQLAYHQHPWGGPYTYAAQGPGGVGYTMSAASGYEGSSEAHPNMQPWSAWNIMLKL